MMSNDTLNSLLLRESRWLRKNKEKSKEEDRDLRYDVKRAESFVTELNQAALVPGNNVFLLLTIVEKTR